MKARNFPKKVVRFANKAYSWLDAVKNPLGTHIIWLDADVATKDTISQEWLDNVIQDNVSVHIGSEFPKIKHDWASQMYYTCETGFYCLDLTRGQSIVSLYETVYKNSEDYDLRVLYDGDVYGYCVKQFEQDLKMIDLNPKKHHTAFSRIALKEKLVHWKGKIKKDIDIKLLIDYFSNRDKIYYNIHRFYLICNCDFTILTQLFCKKLCENIETLWFLINPIPPHKL
jgi:hypothetical protein